MLCILELSVFHVMERYLFILVTLLWKLYSNCQNLKHGEKAIISQQSTEMQKTYYLLIHDLPASISLSLYFVMFYSISFCFSGWNHLLDNRESHLKKLFASLSPPQQYRQPTSVSLDNSRCLINRLYCCPSQGEPC